MTKSLFRYTHITNVFLLETKLLFILNLLTLIWAFSTSFFFYSYGIWLRPDNYIFKLIYRKDINLYRFFQIPFNRKKTRFFLNVIKKDSFWKTVQRAPMAHRQWSQEQYKIVFYNFYIQIFVPIPPRHSNIKTFWLWYNFFTLYKKKFNVSSSTTNVFKMQYTSPFVFYLL